MDENQLTLLRTAKLHFSSVLFQQGSAWFPVTERNCAIQIQRLNDKTIFLTCFFEKHCDLSRSNASNLGYKINF